MLERQKIMQFCVYVCVCLGFFFFWGGGSFFAAEQDSFFALDIGFNFIHVDKRMIRKDCQPHSIDM